MGGAPCLSADAWRLVLSILPLDVHPKRGQRWGSTDVTLLVSLLRINGHPGNYVRIAGKWRLEEVRDLP